METRPFVLLGIKVQPGPIRRHKIENLTLENTVYSLKLEAEKKANIPSSSLELIHHGRILKDNETLQNSGVKNGEMVHVLKKKPQNTPPPPQSYSDAQLQQLNTELRTLGCTPNAPGWTRAMQLLNDESAMAEIIEHAPSLAEDCMTLSILHEVELLAALGANVQTMRRGANAFPDLPNALRLLLRLVRSRSNYVTTNSAPTSGFAYSLEALSEDEDVDVEEIDEEESRNPITPEMVAAALRQAVNEASLTSNTRGQDITLQTPPGSTSATPSVSSVSGNSSIAGRSTITPQMLTEAFAAAAAADPAGTPMEQSTAASSSQSPSLPEQQLYRQLMHMHEMGLLDDALNMRALMICAGDENAAINLVLSGVINDE